MRERGDGIPFERSAGVVADAVYVSVEVVVWAVVQVPDVARPNWVWNAAE